MRIPEFSANFEWVYNQVLTHNQVLTWEFRNYQFLLWVHLRLECCFFEINDTKPAFFVISIIRLKGTPHIIEMGICSGNWSASLKVAKGAWCPWSVSKSRVLQCSRLAPGFHLGRSPPLLSCLIRLWTDLTQWDKVFTKESPAKLNLLKLQGLWFLHLRIRTGSVQLLDLPIHKAKLFSLPITSRLCIAFTLLIVLVKNCNQWLQKSVGLILIDIGLLLATVLDRTGEKEVYARNW